MAAPTCQERDLWLSHLIKVEKAFQSAQPREPLMHRPGEASLASVQGSDSIGTECSNHGEGPEKK